ncbi:hypothetical protein CLOP_g14458 [Closterium sp. NIES-67]|nr:hypothetical protein CLOP_g18366 [Closterium sp. NIES-67]GJP73690.1 hypothetical protein CLOP_g4379 [Closterium sp. NIES-67]GJP84400.1 hypothetical protein CLOP_g14458 [Closterium sp. NIES-67]
MEILVVLPSEQDCHLHHLRPWLSPPNHPPTEPSSLQQPHYPCYYNPSDLVPPLWSSDSSDGDRWMDMWAWMNGAWRWWVTDVAILAMIVAFKSAVVVIST